MKPSHRNPLIFQVCIEGAPRNASGRVRSSIFIDMAFVFAGDDIADLTLGATSSFASEVDPPESVDAPLQGYQWIKSGRSDFSTARRFGNMAVRLDRRIGRKLASALERNRVRIRSLVGSKDGDSPP